MCDRFCCCSHCVYQGYMKHYRRMEAWVRQLHQNVNPPTVCTCKQRFGWKGRSCTCNFACSQFAPIRPSNRRSRRHTLPYRRPEQSESSPEGSTESSAAESLNRTSSEEEHCEYEFNADIIFAMRAAKENATSSPKETKTSSSSKDTTDFSSKTDTGSSSKESSDSSDETSSEGASSYDLEKECYKEIKVETDLEAEQKAENELKEFLYGKNAPMIAGLETASIVNFNRLVTRTQANNWPVMPLSL